MELLDFLKAEIAPDGHHLTLFVETDTGPQAIEANATMLASLLENLATALQAAGQVANDPDAPVLASEVISFRVDLTHDRKKVMLGLRLETNRAGANTIHAVYGVLPPMDAKHLGDELRRCASLCK